MLEKIKIDASPISDSPPVERSWKKVIPGLGISLLSLVVVFYFADFQSVTQALQLANYRLVAGSATITLLWLVVRGLVSKTLLRDRPSWLDSFLAVNEGYLINNILPLRLGELARAYFLGRKSSLGFFQVFPSVIIERLMDLGMAVGLLLATLPLVVGGNWARSAAFAAGILVLVLYCGLYLLACFPNRAHTFLTSVLDRIPRIGRRIQSFLPDLFSGLEVLTDGKRFLSAVGWVLLNWILAVGQYYLLMLAFFPQARFLWAAFSLGVVSLGIAAPSSPGAVGVLELSLVGALAVFKLDPSTALAFALVMHAIQYVLTGAIGAYALARDGDSLTSIYNRVRTLRREPTTPNPDSLLEDLDRDSLGNKPKY